MSDEAEAGGEGLQARLGHGFAEPALLEQALAHPSYAGEHGGGHSNERLEFLGDAVLDLAVARLLFETHPTWNEGRLTRARAALVNQRALAAQARVLGLGAEIRFGRTEQRGGGAEKDSILANVFEAVVGALYLDAGLEPVLALVRRRFGPAIASEESGRARDPKTRFQEWAHARFRCTPRYRTLTDTGVDDADDRFTVEVQLDQESWGRGAGRRKRDAERAAAEQALARAGADD